MRIVVRVVGTALATGVVVGCFGASLYGPYPDSFGLGLFLGAVGGVIGAIAGAAHEITRPLSPLRTASARGTLRREGDA